MCALDEAHLDLDFAYGEITRVGVDLALQWLKNEGLFAMCIGKLGRVIGQIALLIRVGWWLPFLARM